VCVLFVCYLCVLVCVLACVRACVCTSRATSSQASRWNGRVSSTTASYRTIEPNCRIFFKVITIYSLFNRKRSFVSHGGQGSPRHSCPLGPSDPLSRDLSWPRLGYTPRSPETLRERTSSRDSRDSDMPLVRTRPETQMRPETRIRVMGAQTWHCSKPGSYLKGETAVRHGPSVQATPGRAGRCSWRSVPCLLAGELPAVFLPFTGESLI
jgi:hypothetical protein